MRDHKDGVSSRPNSTLGHNRMTSRERQLDLPLMRPITDNNNRNGQFDISEVFLPFWTGFLLETLISVQIRGQKYIYSFVWASVNPFETPRRVVAAVVVCMVIGTRTKQPQATTPSRLVGALERDYRRWWQASHGFWLGIISGWLLESQASQLVNPFSRMPNNFAFNTLPRYKVTLSKLVLSFTTIKGEGGIPAVCWCPQINPSS